MTSFRDYPLGQNIPDSPHAVTASLPTMQDVIDYEEKAPHLANALTHGYPRFVRHFFIDKLEQYFQSTTPSLENKKLFFPATKMAAHEMLAFIDDPQAELLEELRLFIIHIPLEANELLSQASNFLQHSGCSISSRKTEDILSKLKLIEKPFDEAKSQCGDVKEKIAELAPGYTSEDIHLCNCGMNAFYAAFKTIKIIQPKSRKTWVQLGWLYLDTIKILESFLGPHD